MLEVSLPAAAGGAILKPTLDLSRTQVPSSDLETPE